MGDDDEGGIIKKKVYFIRPPLHTNILILEYLYLRKFLQFYIYLRNVVHNNDFLDFVKSFSGFLCSANYCIYIHLFISFSLYLHNSIARIFCLILLNVAVGFSLYFKGRLCDSHQHGASSSLLCVCGVCARTHAALQSNLIVYLPTIPILCVQWCA